jgi:hypothetical protein
MENENEELEKRLKSIEDRLSKIELKAELEKQIRFYEKQRELDFMLNNPPILPNLFKLVIKTDE